MVRTAEREMGAKHFKLLAHTKETLKNAPVDEGFKNILDGLPDPVIIVGPDLRILHANTATEEQFGLRLFNESFYALTRQPEALACIRKAKEEGRSAETKILFSDGKFDSTFRFSVSPIDLPRIRTEWLVISMTDVSHVNDAEQIRREFVANVSHELRSPLTTLTGFIETLKGEASEDKGARSRFLQIMENEAARMERLVSDLLSLSKLEADERIRPKDTVDVCDVVRNTISVLRPIADRSGSSIELVGKENGLIVSGDLGQLTQVFHNLIENALKYGSENGTVMVNCLIKHNIDEILGPVACVEVTDQGDGIDAVHLPRLTERFYRVDKHRSREVGGTGLGLAIVKHIVNRHRGRIAIASQLGVGSNFSVMVPLQTQSPST